MNFYLEVTETIRAFIAIELDDAITKMIGDIERQLASLDCDIRLVKPENCHLTLKFLGEIRIKKIPSIVDVVGSQVKKSSRLSFHLTGLGAFPSLHAPRIVWVGVGDHDSHIANFVNSLENTLGNIGIEKEDKSFHPHITMGRVKSNKNASRISKFIKSHGVLNNVSQITREITLFKSTLNALGPRYESIGKFAFLQ